MSLLGHFSGSGGTVVLSENGSILVVADTGADVVRVFDKRGSVWTQRGNPIQGKIGSGFGYRIKIATKSSNDCCQPYNSRGVHTARIREKHGCHQSV
eukprot:scaffold34585_cov221-Amphora_coffeaeformis.AAC.2